uniref:ATP synthase F0 subunit 8 n=1 Tax=Pseudoxenodon stejnegeri TaxID=1938231 RepID=A0A7S6XZ09_9SAUR|nr:ATP synthase F0 subunit 8 [Pseudoxenodon stejnegeri]QOW83892.1 ATP synthase F0 subunit 8 [Pseudoxenodon stejnegeri]
MPQLDTIFILAVYLWTWLTLPLLTQKIKAFTMPTEPKKQHMTTIKSTPMLPWM